MTLLILAMMFPLVAVITKATEVPDAYSTEGFLIRYFPFFALAAGGLAWFSYPDRPVVSWILLVVLALSYAAVFFLI